MKVGHHWEEKDCITAMVERNRSDPAIRRDYDSLNLIC